MTGLKKVVDQSVDAVQIDPKMKIEQSDFAGLEWLSPNNPPFRLSGFYWFKQDAIYRRLPLSPNYDLPKGVYSLANATAGGQIAFQTDSPRLAIRVELAGSASMYHMPATGQCGFDLYLGDPGEQKYYRTTRFKHTQTSYEFEFYNFPARELRHITLNFPLYQGVLDVQIGIEPMSRIEPPIAYRSNKKVIIYGNSITQGGCASRPGMLFTNILSRRFPLEFLNFGFSGKGRAEPEVVRTICEITDPALLILDYEGIGSVEHLKQTFPEFVRAFRERHPVTPILALSRIPYSHEYLVPSVLEFRMNLKHAGEEMVNHFRQMGDLNIHYFNRDSMISEAICNEYTVDTGHPSDLGFWHIAEALTPIMQQLLKNELSIK